jgi:hypothetical protein
MAHQEDIHLTKKWSISKKTLLSVLVFLAVTAWLVVLFDLYINTKKHPLSPHPQIKTLFNKKPGTTKDIQSIDSWMTFDYIDVFFRLAFFVS